MTTDNALRRAQEGSSFRIDGAHVDPRAVMVAGSMIEPSAASRVFEIRIYGPTIRHELEQAGVNLGEQDLGAFVEKDLRDHPTEALSPKRGQDLNLDNLNDKWFLSFVTSALPSSHARHNHPSVKIQILTPFS